MGRMRRPEVVELKISQGDWLRVKKHLTAGESRRIFANMVQAMTPGEKIHLDPQKVGLTMAAEYLIDWSITDEQDKLVPIRGLSSEQIAQTLENLPLEDFNEIREAIEAHDSAMREAREQEKKLKTATTEYAAIS